MIGLDRINLIIFSKNNRFFLELILLIQNFLNLRWSYLISNFMLILENLVGKMN